MSWLSDLTGVNINAADYTPEELQSAASDAASSVAGQFSPPPSAQASAPKPAGAPAAAAASSSSAKIKTFLKSPLAFGLSGGAVLALGAAAWFFLRGKHHE